MDFHSLSRKELQTLCKKNKIPANITNVAMAEALSALPQVEGVEEFLNGVESETQNSPEKLIPECPDIPKTACRTTTRRKQSEVESQSVISTRRTTRRSAAVEQLETPAMPATRTTRKVAAGASARQRSVAAEEKSMQRGGGGRQSVRLLEKSLREMRLREEEKVEPVKFDVSESDKVSEEIVEKIGVLEDFSTQNQSFDNGNDDDEDKPHEDIKENEYEMEDCTVKLDFDGDDNLGNPSGLDSKDEVVDENFPMLNENEPDPSTGANKETPSDTVISEMANEVHTNDVPSVVEMAETFAMEANSSELAPSPDEIKESLNLEGIVGDESEIKSIQDDQHRNLEVESVGEQSEEVQENEIQEQERILCEKLTSRIEPRDPKLDQDYEECHQVSNEEGMECEEKDELFSDSESEVSQDSVNSKQKDIEKTQQKDVSDTSCNLPKIPEKEMMVSSPFAVDTLQGQFPRPTKKDAALPAVLHFSDINEDYTIDGNGLEPPKDEVDITADEETDLQKLSLRKLTKMVKELQISKKKKGEKNVKDAKERFPLQKLPENCMATTESRKEF